MPLCITSSCGETRFVRGFAPARRGPFVSAKGPKTIRTRAWPQEGAFAPAPIAWAAELASLRQSSPQRGCGTGAQPRPQAPAILSSRILDRVKDRLDPGSSVFAFSFGRKDMERHAGRPLPQEWQTQTILAPRLYDRRSPQARAMPSRYWSHTFNPVSNFSRIKLFVPDSTASLTIRS